MARAAFVFIYSFHMPLFLFLSGLFFNRATITGQKTVERICFFVILGFATKLLVILVPALFGRPIVFSLLSDGGISWFMFALAAYYTIGYVLRNINGPVVLICSVVLGVFVGYDSTIGDYLYLSRIVVFFPFFWAGVLLKASDIDAFTAKVPVRIIGAIALVSFALICIFYTAEVYCYRGLFTGRNSFSHVAIQDCSFAHRLIAYLVSVIMGVGVLAITPRSTLPVLSKGGERTLQVYLLHYPVLNVCAYTGLLATINNLPGFGWLMVVLLGMVIAIGLSVGAFEIPITWLRNNIGKSPI